MNTFETMYIFCLLVINIVMMGVAMEIMVRAKNEDIRVVSAAIFLLVLANMGPVVWRAIVLLG